MEVVVGGRLRREWSRPMEPISDHEKRGKGQSEGVFDKRLQSIRWSSRRLIAYRMR
jgi:hypothetical protein